MIERYTLPKMGNIWATENKYQKWLEIEIFALEAQAKLGNVPSDVVQIVKEKAKFDSKRIDELEETLKHDVIAFLTNVNEHIGEYSRYIHLGMTSSDVLDTSLALLMRDAGNIILDGLNNLKDGIKKRAIEHKHTVMIGRTHGVHAEPITFGLKLLIWYEETKRNIYRIEKAIENISYGKISGAVGTFAHMDPFVEAYVCEKLNLKPDPVSSQIIQRDRHAEYLTTLAIVSSSLEKFATEIRHLQRTEILEVSESFTKGQKGSSAMPHKRNPITCERIVGLSRIIRANALVSLENITLWNERDITHSSTERIIIPDSTILLDYIITKMTDIINNLVVYEDHMKRNLYKSFNLIFSQKVLLKLIDKGMSREKGYEITQKNAMKSWEEEKSFKDLLSNDEEVKKYLSKEDIDQCFDENEYLKNVDYIFERTIDNN
jgi:adenylosuccinate lyase